MTLQETVKLINELSPDSKIEVCGKLRGNIYPTEEYSHALKSRVIEYDIDENNGHVIIYVKKKLKNCFTN